jgi:glycosyltransferase involved in cell wall biosynthesis
MVGNRHLVTIGMPVFNAEKYLKEALDSILAQTYEDFEVVISDNASTDKTQAICQEYVKKDDRVIYHRCDRNFGAVWNFNRVFSLSSSPYFKWAAYDDLIAPTFLYQCVSVLEKDHSVALCHSKTARCNELGQVVGFYDNGSVTDSPKPQTRFRDVLWRKDIYWIIFGVLRRAALIQTPLFQGFLGSDWNLLGDISLIGRIIEIPQYLLFRRDHQKAYTTSVRSPNIVHDYRNSLAWWTGSRKKALVVLPHWRNCLEFFKSVRRAPLKWSEQLSCYNEICEWVYREGSGKLKWDLENEFKFWRIQLNR